MATKTANPLPVDGVAGKLTRDQESSLKDMWKELFALVDSAPTGGVGSGTAAPLTAKQQAGGDIPKDDDAKARMKAEQETRDSKAAFAQFGSVAFLATFWRFVAMDDPDGMVLRFLRARKWSPTAGVGMLASCMKWRMEGDVEKIFDKGEEGMKDSHGFIAQMSSGKTYTQGTDRYGRPVTYVHVAKHKTWDQDPKALEDFVIFQMESVRCLFAPPVDKIVMVFDMTGFGIRNMDWRCILFIVKCLEAYYPESLNVMLIHNAPWVFQGIWKLLAPMLDPVVRAKIEMTKSTEDLLVHISKEHLVKELGGSSTWSWEYPKIVPGENKAQVDNAGRERAQAERDALVADYMKITREWMHSDDPLVAKKRQLAALKMRAQYFTLDPYIRGRGAYHRNGNIVGNGLVFFEYPGIAPEGEWEVSGYETCREQSLLEAQVVAKEIRDFKM